MLLPYIISTRNDWSTCKLRVFALATNKNELELEERKLVKNFIIVFKRYNGYYLIPVWHTYLQSSD